MKRWVETAVVTAIVLTVGSADAAFVEIEGSTGGGVTYDYSISDREVSYGDWAASGLAGGATYTNALGSAAPVVDISWHQAAQYCNWMTSGSYTDGAYTISGGLVTGTTDRDSIDMDALVSTYNTVYVMPTQAEWKKAAYWDGSAQTLYANGSNTTAPVPESDAIYTRLNDSVGLNPPSSIPWEVTEGNIEQNGTYNMTGNVWEWQEVGAGDSTVTFNGGDWFLGENFIRSTTDASDTKAGAYNIGLRVAAIPEPGTISLMGLSTISLFMTRTIRRRKTLGKSLVPVRRVRGCDVFDEHAAAADMEEEGLDLAEFFKTCVVEVKTSFQQSHESISVRFWNHMVARHERRVARRVAFRASFKKKALGALDGFLALIMK